MTDDVQIDLHCPNFKKFKEAWIKKDVEKLESFFAVEDIGTILSCISMLVREARTEQHNIDLGLAQTEAARNTPIKDLLPILEKQFKLMK